MCEWARVRVRVRARESASESTKCCACYEICASRFACYEICFTCHEICKVHEVLRLPRNLQKSQVSKSYDSLHLSRNQSGSKITTMSKVL